MKYWWVNHKQTLRQEIHGEYLWSPKFEANGRRSHFYDNMRLANRGDFVLSYANQLIKYVGVVSDAALSAPKPDEFGLTGEYWANEVICPQKVVQLNVSLRHDCLPSRKRPAELVWVAQTGAAA
jgi:hypothetical protein